jgi:hypothetical protein
MQPVNLAVAELEAVAAGLEAVEAGVVLLPHAVASRVTTAPAANAAANEVCLNFPPLRRIANART